MSTEEIFEYRIDSRNQLSFRWKELWSYRELFYFFTWRDIKVKYKQTALGIIWVLLQPLLLMAIFTYFFGKVLGVEPEGMPYAVFAFSGVLLWNFFSAAVTNAGNSMVGNAGIIKKIYFPRLVVPLSAILVALTDLFITLVLFFIFLAVYGHPVSWQALLYWPCALLLGIVGATGLGCLLAALMVKYRDFRFIVPFALQIAFFITPVVYPVSRISFAFLKYLLALNPMYGAIALFRFPLTAHNSMDYTLIAISVVSSGMLMLIGLLYFRKTELFFADVA